MKKKVIVFALCITLCSLFLASIGIVDAYKAGYTHTSYQQTTIPTVDGKYTTTTEWQDCKLDFISPSAFFRDKWDLQMGDATLVPNYYLVEIVNDGTAEAGDYIELCFDSDCNGGTTPKTDDYKLVISPTNATWYKGTGTGWATMATPAASVFKYATTISTSPVASAPHRIYEIMIEKEALLIGFGSGPMGELWFRAAYLDASTSANPAGLQSWPPGSANVPDDWGYVPWTQDPIPEGFSFGILLVLSSVVVVAGAVLVRKRSGIAKLVSILDK